MKAGITLEQLHNIHCPITRDLIKKLLSPSTIRLGKNKGFE